MNEELINLESNLRLYIAAWFWQVLAIMFICFTFLFFILGYLGISIAFIILFAVCQARALIRKRERLEQ